MKEGWEYKKLGEVCEKSKNIRWEEIGDELSFSYIDLSSVDRDSLSINSAQIINKSNAPSRLTVSKRTTTRFLRSVTH